MRYSCIETVVVTLITICIMIAVTACMGHV